MSAHVTEHRSGLGPGYTQIIAQDEAGDSATGLGLVVLRLRAGEHQRLVPATETAYLLMQGAVEVTVGAGAGPYRLTHSLSRASLFDDGPSCIHVCAGTEVLLGAQSEVELTIYSVANTARFEARVYRPADVPDERRGLGQVGDACLRLVRTIFDDTRTDPNCLLVLGEVVTLPGRWSSYPPHHHPQPEIYHYRFSLPQGFGFAQLGEHVLRVQQYDTVKILAGQDHAQAAAPGYAMYYSWAIRHLEGNRYGVPEFTREHAWTMAPDAQVWQPSWVTSEKARDA